MVGRERRPRRRDRLERAIEFTVLIGQHAMLAFQHLRQTDRLKLE